MKTAKIILAVKDPDSWWSLIEQLGLENENDKIEQHFEHGEYATFEIEVDTDLRIVGGRILPRSWEAELEDEDIVGDDS